MYLIMKATPLADQYECNYDREPLRIVETWKNYPLPDGCEVYEINPDGSLTCVKQYWEHLETGMRLYCHLGARQNDVCFKFPNLTRDDPIPQEVLDFAFQEGLQYTKKFLLSSGYASFWNKTSEYVYEEYTRG